MRVNFAFLRLCVLCVLWVLGAAASLAAENEVAGRRAALVIGNSSYENLPKLPNAVSDADRVGEVLRKANFEVTVGENLDKAGLEKAVRSFLQSLNGGDVALFYYSGHAVQVAGENFVLPVDAKLTSSYDLEVESYNVSSLLDYMRASSGLQILVLDACRDNPFRNQQYFLGERKVDVGDKKGLASLVPRQGSLIVYSTAPDQVAYDGADDISPFAGAFTNRLLMPNREVREVLTTIRADVIDKTGGRQVPWDVSSLTSQFYFVSAQNLLTLSQSVTEVRVSPDTKHIELDIAPPIASGGMQLSATFDKLPRAGLLLLDDKAIKAGASFDAARLSDVVYVTDPGQKAVELMPYSVRADTGQVATGAVAVVFDPGAAPQGGENVASAAEANAQGDDLAPIEVSMTSDIGTGFSPMPAVVRGKMRDGWLRVGEVGGSAQLAVDQTMLVVGDLVAPDDLPKIKVRPALQATGQQAKIVLTPVEKQAEAKPVVIAVAAQTNACDELAAEPLDIQAVNDGVFPNDIDIPRALAACKQAVEDFPDIARFKFQYGRALYAGGDFDGAVKQVRAAVDGGHVRAGQFLGRLYQLGSGVELAPEKAIPLFEAAARKGDPYGQYSLARALLDGKGTKADPVRGMELLAKAAESGHTYALNQLGTEYRNGQRVKQDTDRALVMFEKSAGRGDVWGEVNLGLMYRDGLSVKQDPSRAYELFESANAKLHPYAATLMAMMDRDKGGADKARLLDLFRQSADRGDGWGAYYAAEMIAEDPALAKSKDETIRLYALAAGRNAGNASEQARGRLAALPKEAVAREVQMTLIRLGASGIHIDGKYGKKDRQAAAKILGNAPPSEAIDLLVALMQREWVAGMPRLDML